MKTQNYHKNILKYLKRGMDQSEVAEFEKTLKNDHQLQKDFLVERSIFIAAHDMGREKIRNRFTELEKERSRLPISPEKTIFQLRNEWIKKAAFMHQTNISTSSLPVSDDTLKDFLAGEDKENNNEGD